MIDGAICEHFHSREGSKRPWSAPRRPRSRRRCSREESAQRTGHLRANPCSGYHDIDHRERVSLDPIGQTLYDARAAYMVATNQGLTTTYNQLKDPDYAPDRPPEDLAAIRRLRQLHEDLDRAVLAAYGWSDIPVPPFCPATDAERAAVSLFEDTVIDRLFALNAERAAEERHVFGTAVAAKQVAASKPKSSPRKPRAAKNQTSMLDDD